MALFYTYSIGNQLYNTMVAFKMQVVYLARDISAFVMYCVYGESGSSLLIESTNSMISTVMVSNSLSKLFFGGYYSD